MGRKRNPLPKLRRRDDRDEAYAEFWDPGTGRKRYVTLGPWGTPETQAAFGRLVADVTAARIEPARGEVTVGELFARFLKHAEQNYRGSDGRPSSEIANYRTAIAVASRVCLGMEAKSFGPLAIQRVRDAMVAAGWSRTHVNAQVSRVRRIFKWAAANELVPAEKWLALGCVRGLSRGRTTARECDPIRPAPDADVEQTLPHLPAAVASMVRFHLLTGCRAQDVCRLRVDQIDRTGPVWVFRPKQHKGTWRGKTREVFIGPRCQELLAPLLPAAGDGYVFSPRRQVEEQRAARTAARKTPRFPSHLRRNAEKRVDRPKRRPADAYTTASYAKAIRRACETAGVPPWSPLQLRHTAGTRFRAEFGLETARVLLGHASAATSEIYAEADRAKAAAAAAVVG